LNRLESKVSETDNDTNIHGFFETFSVHDDQVLVFPLSISQLAEAADTSVHTVRNYCNEGLLDCSDRTANGYSLFDPCALYRLRFLRAGMTAGLFIADIKPLLELLDSHDDRLLSAIDELKLKVSMKKNHLKALENKLAELIVIFPKSE